MSEPERTADGHHIVVNGRRWRASDPSIPDTLRQELVNELMAARRLIRTEGRAARARVQDAKVALGERGYEWWREPSDEERRSRIESATRALLRGRDGSSICPSDVARIVGGAEWRDLMPVVRDVAERLREGGEVVIMQKGKAVHGAFRGPIRIAPSQADDVRST